MAAGAMLLALGGCKQSGTGQAVSNQPPSSAAPAPADSTPPPAPAQPAITVPQGTIIEARIDQTLSTARTRQGDRFTASLEVPVDIGGREVLSRGERIHGHVTTSRSSGRMEGRAAIGITLDSIEYRGRSVPVETTLDTKTTEAHKKRNIEFIGGGSGLGAVIGAIAGGGKGAAIGAAAGAGAGTAGAAFTGKKDVEIPAETVFRFRLKAPVELAQ